MRLYPTEEEPADLLSKVLNGDNLRPQPRLCTRTFVFSDPALDSVEIKILQDILGIWVDPIDSAFQYIKCSAGIKPNQGISPGGLQCVTILIGVHDIQTGVPLMGVINQPFVSQDLNTLRWKGQCYWGLLDMETKFPSLCFPSLQAAAVKGRAK